MMNKSLFRQIGIFFIMSLILAIIHSVFRVQFAINVMVGLASKKDLLPSINTTIVVMGIIYGAYFMATYYGCKHVIREEE